MSTGESAPGGAGPGRERSGHLGGRGVPYIAAGGLALGLWAWAAVWAARTGCAKDTGGVRLVPARIDVNSADGAALQALPGVGRTLARRIVEERTVRGRFGRKEDLMRVRGFTRELVEGIGPFVTFGELGGPAAPAPERRGPRR